MNDTALGLIVMATMLAIAVWLVPKLWRTALKGIALTFFAILCIVSTTARDAFIATWLDERDVPEPARRGRYRLSEETP